ncbi:MAG: alpha/beta hydrolase [Cocleimonas sp.]|nr:alpha/beta hydrolase [Cocleimonas sp.]
MSNSLKTVEDYTNLTPVKADHRLSYGEHPEQYADLYLPKQSNKKGHPVIILIHGGCWRAQFGLAQLGQLSQALTTLGFAVYNLEFRRLGNGGGWPVTFEDVALGADSLKDIAKKYSLDLSKVISMGHSAGGHLALWLAGRHHLPKNSSLRRDDPLQIHQVIALAGIPDLEAGVEQNICRGACQALAGGLPKDIPNIYQQASPHHLLPFNIPQWHIVGELDPIVPVEYLTPYIESAKRHDEVHFEVIPNIGHFEMVMPDSIAWATIKKILLLP